MRWINDAKQIALALSSVVFLAAVGCQSGGEVGGAVDKQESSKQRITAPNVPQSDMEELVAGQNALALDLLERLPLGPDNQFFSPVSIDQAMAMVYAGARGETARQMADVLHFTLPGDRLHPAINALDLALASRGQGAEGKDGKPFRLHVVNAAWGQRGYRFLPEYLDVLAANYGAGMNIVDFAEHTEQARITINAWVADQTEDKIPELIPQGILDSMTRLVLTNAIYFNAAWKYEFEHEMTWDDSFTRQDGSTVTVHMMHQLAGFKYAATDRVQVVELPYDGDEIAMDLIVPDAGEFENVADNLTVDQLVTLLGSLQVKQVQLAMPKFQYRTTIMLKDVFQDMGMTDLFSPGVADLSGMDGTRDLFVSAIIHKTFVDVDEAGTEAAAATAVIVEGSGMPEFDVDLTIDRPFLFVIRDLPTGAILFMGAVHDPSAH